MCKRSSLTLPKVKTADDESKELVNKENVNHSNIDKLPEISKSSNGNNDAEEKRKNSDNSTKSHCGKAKRSPKKNKFIKRLSNGERVKRFVNDEEDNVNGIIEKKLTPEATILRLTGGIELVPLLARRRRIGARTLPSSDVTRPPEQSCQYVCY